MKKVTVDTSALPLEDYLPLARARGFSFFLVRTTDREAPDNRDVPPPNGVEVLRIMEPGVWGDGRWDGHGYWTGPEDEECLEAVLTIIGNGSFPRKGGRSDLNHGQRNQLRDAMIFTSHVRHRHDIFLTNDMKGFINDGRREALESKCSTRIPTTSEFIELLGGGVP